MQVNNLLKLVYMKKILLTACIGMMVSLVPVSVHAIAAIWDNEGGNNLWHDPVNWGLNGVPGNNVAPGIADTAIFRAPPTSPAGTITLTNDAACLRIRQQAGAAARIITIDPGEMVNRTMTIAGGAELFDFNTANSSFTFDGTANGNGAKLLVQINSAPGTVINGAGSLIFNCDVSGAGGFVLNAGSSGGGKLILNGVNSYTGVTTVNAGTLLVNGSTAAASAVTVAGGALGGTGTIGAAATISGGTLAPGQSAGTLTFGSDLTLGATSVLSYELLGTDMTVGGNVNDLAVVGGNLTLDGTLNIIELLADSFQSANVGDKWRLFDYTGVLTDNGLDVGSMPPNLTYAIDTGTANQVNLVVTAVPEPSTVVLGLLGGLGLLLVLQRRRSA